MRIIVFISLLALSIGCTGPKKAVTTTNKLNGTWIPVKQEIAGKELPKAAYEKQNLVVADSNYTFTAESVDKGVVKYNGNKMDIYGREGVNTGKHFTAIYKLENEELTICYNLAGDSYPDAFETKSKPTLFMSVFKKQQ